MDLKLSNFIWDQPNATLKLIDFRVSMILIDHDTLVPSGFVGIRDLTTPKVHSCLYNAYRAD
ncbi:hypothetical protein K435DRAFT_774879 [Dendrothele bispora CBS 962.96]|uniref:Protein kinase domain-containing protein n=1 Tax=Dendrothele bispora (strain CBS 962.96) TaxID=1314807 RepID=A0A4S8ML86_DENBC|nr:hypothetical protein K435DRAFT_774879 [Dendrothele bispora CBS 962.96]